jgi:hypothetical protein
MDDIKKFVGDPVAEIGSSSDDEQKAQDGVSCDHDLRCKLGTELLFAVSAKHTEESEKENGAKANNRDHGVAKVDMHSKSSVQRHKRFDEGLAKRRNRKTRHGDRDEGHLEQDSMHRPEFQRR